MLGWSSGSRCAGATLRLRALGFVCAALVLGCGASRGDAQPASPGLASAGALPEARRQPPPLVALVGEGSMAAFQARIDSMVRSPYFTNLAESMRNDPDPSARLEAEWLLDLLGRSQSLVGASWVRPDGTLENLYMLRGRYTPADVRHMVQGEQGATEARQSGALVFRKGDRAIALLGEHTIAVGSADRIAGVLARAHRPVPPAEAGGAIAGLDQHPSLGRDDIAFFVLAGPEMRRVFGEAGVGEELRDVQSLAFGMTLADGIEARLEATTASPEQAERLQGLLDAQLVMLSETAVAHVLGLGPALRRTRTEAEGNHVKAFTFVDDATLKHAIESARELGLSVEVETPPGADEVPGGALPPNTD